MSSDLSFTARTNRRFSETSPIPGHSPSSLFVSFSFYALILLHIARPVKRGKTEYSSFSSKFIVKGRPSAPFGRLFGLFGLSVLYHAEIRPFFALPPRFSARNAARLRRKSAACLRTLSQTRRALFIFPPSRWRRSGALSPRRWTARPAGSGRSNRRAA